MQQTTEPIARMWQAIYTRLGLGSRSSANTGSRRTQAPDEAPEPIFFAGMTRSALAELCESSLLAAKRAFNEGRYEDAIEIVSSLDHLTGEKVLRIKSLRDARLLRSDAFFHAGLPTQGKQALEALEEYYGPMYESRMQSARLSLFSGNYSAGLQEVEEAMLLMPARRNNDRLQRHIALLKVDLLTHAGELDQARDYFLNVFPCQDPARPLTYQQMASLRKTVNSPSSLRRFKEVLTPAFSSFGRRALNALFHYSIAARDQGAHAEAILAIQRRLILGTKVLAPGTRPEKSKQNWSQSAGRALLHLKEDLEAAGINFFLISGTLLGCVRENNILGHDKDIDVGVLDQFEPHQIRAALERTGRFLILPEVTPRLQRVKHSSGVMIDIFIHWMEDGRLWHEGQKTRWWNTPFELREVEFLGKSFLAPENADLYLQENYGDWRIPVVDFETFCDTPNMEVADEYELLWYYYRALLDHYYAGKPMQFAKVWNAVKQIQRPGIEVRMAVESAQAKLASAAEAEEGA